MSPIHCAAFLAAVVVACAASPAAAQYDAYQQPLGAQLQALPTVELKGTVERVGPQGVAIKCDDQSFLVQVDPTMTQVQCSGTADAGYLKPGVMVRFETELDKRWNAIDPLEELSVVTPSPSAQPGIHYDQPVGDEKRQAKNKGGNDSCVVVGTVKLYKDGQLHVLAGGKTVKVDVAKDAKIGVEIDDFSLAAAGDEMTAKAWQVRPPANNQPGQLYAQELTITMAKPLPASAAAAKGKKPAKGGRRNNR